MNDEGDKRNVDYVLSNEEKTNEKNKVKKKTGKHNENEMKKLHNEKW